MSITKKRDLPTDTPIGSLAPRERVRSHSSPARRLSYVGEIEIAWGGALEITPAGLPVVDEVPGMKNALTVRSYGGSGLTFSRFASEITAGIGSSRQDRDIDLFRFGAIPAPRKAA